MSEAVLGLDVGTTSARALVASVSGNVLGSSVQRLHWSHPRPGLVEQDAGELWATVRQVIASALADAGVRPAGVAAIGVTTQRSSVVVWERQIGEPVAPMLLWSDLRGAARAEELQEAGFPVIALAAAAKLESVLDQVADGRSRLRSGELLWGTLDSYLVFRLSGGAHLTDRSAAWASGYLDPDTASSWNSPLLEAQRLAPSSFPTLRDSWGELAHTSVDAFGAAVPITALIADQQSAMLAHGHFGRGAAKVTYGTSAVTMACTGPAPVESQTLVPMVQWCSGSELLFALEGMVLSAGSLLEWMTSIGLFGATAESTSLAASTPSSGGVFVRPALQGTGAPHNELTQTALIGGLTGATTRAEIARAALESIAFRVREVVGEIELALGTELRALPVDGGLSRSDTLLQIQADITQRPVRRHAIAEATALGAIVGAGLGAALLDRTRLDGFVRYQATFEPQISRDQAEAAFVQWRRAVSARVPAAS